jgi:hypothetical protein
MDWSQGQGHPHARLQPHHPAAQGGRGQGGAGTGTEVGIEEHGVGGAGTGPKV